MALNLRISCLKCSWSVHSELSYGVGSVMQTMCIFTSSLLQTAMFEQCANWAASMGVVHVFGILCWSLFAASRLRKLSAASKWDWEPTEIILCVGLEQNFSFLDVKLSLGTQAKGKYVHKLQHFYKYPQEMCLYVIRWVSAIIVMQLGFRGMRWSPIWKKFLEISQLSSMPTMTSQPQ